MIHEPKPYSHIDFERADTRNDTDWFGVHWENHKDEMISHMHMTIWEWSNFRAWLNKMNYNI